MDILTDIFDTLDLKGALYFRTDFSPPWAVKVPDLEHAARFHLVVEGRCAVTVEGCEPIELNAGDLILIPRGRSHILSAAPEQEAPSLEKVLSDANYEGSGILVIGEGDPRASTKMVCGHFTFRKGADHMLLNSLPDFLYTTAGDRAKEPLLDEMLRLISRRMFFETLGSEAALTRMSEIVFIELLRAGISDNTALKQFFSAIRDKFVGQALNVIHKSPAQPWTVDTLAREVGMSRSRFADRFSQLMGTSPMAYLLEWRLQKSLKLLQEKHGNVQQIAYQVGYQSAAAFTRAFTKRFGDNPSHYGRSSTY